MSSVRISVPVVALVALAFQLPIFDRWFSHMDEGHVLLFADLVAQGGELYRDATLYPLPGAFYALAQAFKLFGASIWVSRWIVMLEFALFVAGVYLLMRRAASPRVAAASVFGLLLYRILAFPHWQVYSYSTTSLLLIVGALLCQLRWSDDAPGARRPGWLLAAGLLFGLSVYCKQDYGAAALLVMGAGIALDARARGLQVLPPLAIFVGAGAAVGACVGLYFAVQGVLPDLLQQTVLNHVRGIGSFEYTTYPKLFPLFAQDPAVRDESGLFAFFPGIVTTIDLETLRQDWLFRETFVYDVGLKLFYWGPYAFVAFALLRVFRLREERNREESASRWLTEALLAGFSAAFLLLLTVNRPQDFLHVAVLVWPMICLAILHASALWRAQRALALALAVVVALPALATVGYAARGYGLLREQNSRPVAASRAGIRARESDARMLDEVVSFVRENSEPDERVAIVPYFPMVHFLADRAGPHRSAYIVWPFPEFEDRDERIIRAFDEQQTRLAVYNFTQFATFPTMDRYAPELFQYLVDHFETVRVFSYDKSGYRLAGLRRSERAERPSPLLDDAWNETLLWIESDEAPPLAVAPSRRGDWMARESWPFRRTLALRPPADARSTRVRIPCTPAAGDVLQTAVAVHPESWFEVTPFRTRFELAVVSRPASDADTGRQRGESRRTLYARTLDPHRELSDRGWFDVQLALEAFAGQPVWIELGVSVDAPEAFAAAGRPRIAGFAEPRIVSRAGPSGSDPLGSPQGVVAD